MEINSAPLESLGLTKNEITVFMVLFRLGKASAPEIKEKTGLHNSVTYNSLERLKKNGLVSSILLGKRKIYHPVSPDQLVSIAQEKKDQISILAQSLKKINFVEDVEQLAEMYIGWKGVKNAFDLIIETLPRGSDYLAFGVGVEEQFDEEAKKFFKDFQKKRSLMNYKIRIVLNESTRKQIKQVNYYHAFGIPQFRYVQGFAPIGIIIFGDYILHAAFGESPVAVIIKDKMISTSMKRSFEAMWTIGKE